MTKISFLIREKSRTDCKIYFKAIELEKPINEKMFFFRLILIVETRSCFVVCFLSSSSSSSLLYWNELKEDECQEKLCWRLKEERTWKEEIENERERENLLSLPQRGRRKRKRECVVAFGTAIVYIERKKKDGECRKRRTDKILCLNVH